MKSLLIITDLFLNKYDPTRAPFNREIFRRLANKFHVKIVAPVSWLTYLKIWKGSSFKKRIPYREFYLDIEVFHPIYFYAPKTLRSMQGFFYFASIVNTCAKISAQGFDCIYSCMIYPDGFAATLISKIFHRPLLLNAIGTDINVYTRYPLRSKMITWSLQQSRKIIAVSNDLKNKITTLGIKPEKVAVVYDGVDHNIFDTGNFKHNDNAKKTVLYVGNFKVAKGILDLLEAYRILNCKNTQLVYIGSGPDKNRLISTVHEYHLQEHVQITGPFPHDTIAQWMRNAAVLCLPSHNEGVPNVILEAISCGTPVIATKIGGIPEVVPSDCGYLVPVKQPSVLAEKLKVTLNRNWDRNHIASFGKKYDWNTCVLEISKEIFNAI